MPYNPFVVHRKPKVPEGLRTLPVFLSDLGVSESELRLISAKKVEQYHLVSVRKRSGGMRTLSVPNERLKYIQKHTASLLAPLYQPRWCVQGFVKGRSALQNAQRHLGRKHLVKVDLKDYFNQVTVSRAKGVLRYFELDAGVIDAILTFCTLFGKLPQGAPSSPLLANMVTFSLDQELVRYARTNRLKYTRYADDIVLSSFSKPRLLRPSVTADYCKLTIEDVQEDFAKIFSNQGFELNEEKMRYCGQRASRTVTGYTINEFANVPREHIRRIRSILNDIEKRGYPLAQRRFSETTHSIKSLKASLKGRLNWVSSTKGVSDPVYRRLALRFNGLFPDDCLEIGPDYSKLAQLSTWVIEAERKTNGVPEAQGTAFFLKGVGLVSAAHCLPGGCNYSVFNIDNPSKTYPATIAKTHNHIDLAILDHSIPAESYLALELSDRQANLGEEVFSWGYPEHGPGKRITQKSGRVSSKPRVSGVDMYAVDMKLYQGTSGGPILNSSSAVIGVTHKGGHGEAHDLAILIKHLKDL
ncbi:reverse transcriptase domain-containing protein [Alloyangia pacifica]|uniref:reverse transcriptase domain-containing protein n=1 Tax=Alloyangia pacifica TaxID=311180 RepID=UPI001CD63DCB|nr:reverse transcriptase domain-containing protein [Alloyangia pacifica]MCA0997954.1 trypsin-like peptidase domain-containing protein [Alloyangia pacifica]